MDCHRRTGGERCSPCRLRLPCRCSSIDRQYRAADHRPRAAATPAASIWVVNAYQLAVTVTLLPSRRWATSSAIVASICCGLGVFSARIADMRDRAIVARAGARPRAARFRRGRHHERQWRAGTLHLSSRPLGRGIGLMRLWWRAPPPVHRSRRRSCRSPPGLGCSLACPGRLCWRCCCRSFLPRTPLSGHRFDRSARC